MSTRVIDLVKRWKDNSNSLIPSAGRQIKTGLRMPQYTSFSKLPNNAMLEPMFMGNNINISRFDQQKYEIFEKLIEKHLSFFWRPEEVDISTDRSDYASLPANEKHIFNSNLKYQTLLDSITARSVSALLLPVASTPEMESWIETWAFGESIHSRSYTHILRNLVTDPSEIFDDIVINPEIIKRAVSISKYIDEAILYVQLYQSQGDGVYEVEDGKVTVNAYEVKKKLFLAVSAINALEGIRFFVSFACTFAFAERDKMEGNAKVVKLIARDEALHLNSTQQILNIWASGKDDPDMKKISIELKEEGRDIFISAANQEKDWAKYLFKDGSMIGLNEAILCQYIEYISNTRMNAIGYEPPFKAQTNPIPWINHWLFSDNVQVAPQEAEISSYLVGQVNSSIDAEELLDFDL